MILDEVSEMQKIISKIYLIMIACIAIALTLVLLSQIDSAPDEYYGIFSMWFGENVKPVIGQIILWAFLVFNVVLLVIRKWKWLGFSLPVTIFTYTGMTLISLGDQLTWYAPHVQYGKLILGNSDIPASFCFAVYFAIFSALFTIFIVACYLVFLIIHRSKMKHD